MSSPLLPDGLPGPDPRRLVVRRRRRALLRDGDGDDMDPMGFLINLFDVALVFALALMIALVSNLKMADLLTTQDFTVVKNPGKPNMEIISREAGKVSRYVPGGGEDGKDGSRGQKVGSAYRLPNGDIVYVPED